MYVYVYLYVFVQTDNVYMRQLEWTKVQSDIYIIGIGFRKLVRRFRVIIIIIRQLTDLI